MGEFPVEFPTESEEFSPVSKFSGNRSGLADFARHVIGYHLTQQTRVQNGCW